MKKLKGITITKEQIDKQKEIKMHVIGLVAFVTIASMGLILSYTWILKQLNIL